MRHFASPVLPIAIEFAEQMPVAHDDVSAKLALLDISDQGIFLIGLDGHLAWMNAEARRLTEVRETTSVIGKDWLTFWPLNERAGVLSALNSARIGIPAKFAASCPTAARAEVFWEVFLSPDGPPISGTPTLMAFIQDVTERKTALGRLEWAATHDALTGLANRTLFYDLLDRKIERAKAGAKFALVAFDLDRFKQINERVGHAGGDQLLRVFASRLIDIVPGKGLAARFGGDEFVAIVDIEPGSDAILSLVGAMLNSLKLPYSYLGGSIECTASAGIAIFPDSGRTADDLYMNADIALLAGKAQVMGRAAMFNTDMRIALQRRASSLDLAAAAIAHDWIEPHYQPKIDLATGELCGLEALLRWRQPGGPWQLPDTIAAAFEDKCLATKIFGAMFRKIVLDLIRWQSSACAVPVAINAVAADLEADDFAARLLGRLRESGIPSRLLELEVTEGVFVGDSALHIARVLRKLSDGGIRIALDDFGTGYASLTHLKQFPVHVIKIDRSFVSSVTISHEDRAIVRTMIDLGKSMSIEVVAEGIENEAQLAFVKHAGCDVGQGYLFGKAMSAADIEARYFQAPQSVR